MNINFCLTFSCTQSLIDCNTPIAVCSSINFIVYHSSFSAAFDKETKTFNHFSRSFCNFIEYFSTLHTPQTKKNLAINTQIWQVKYDKSLQVGKEMDSWKSFTSLSHKQVPNRHENQGANTAMGEVHLWHRMKQLSNISPLYTASGGFKSGTHRLAAHNASTEVTGP